LLEKLILSTSAYRRQGLASKLLSHVARKAQEASLAASLAPPPTIKPASTTSKVAAAIKGKGKAADPTTSMASETPKPVLKSIFVHVQLGNEDAKTFWQGQGFTESETIQNYYKPTIEGSRDAWLLEKAIKSDD
jgi:ribosomal protein S18 acetylase RimI-like enzyme